MHFFISSVLLELCCKNSACAISIALKKQSRETSRYLGSGGFNQGKRSSLSNFGTSWTNILERFREFYICFSLSTNISNWMVKWVKCDIGNWQKCLCQNYVAKILCCKDAHKFTRFSLINKKLRPHCSIVCVMFWHVIFLSWVKRYCFSLNFWGNEFHQMKPH